MRLFGIQICLYTAQSLLYLLLLLHYVTFIACVNYYSIVAPGLMKSNRKYTVVVTLHNSDTPCTISISIKGRSYNASNTIRLQSFETKSLDFYPPKLETGDYWLLAEGINGCKFKNQTELLIDSNAGPKIYIQTDKAVYRPQDLVRYRVVILDEHTRPINITEPIRVEIFDKDENRIKQFKDISLTNGVHTGQFQLSQRPGLGRWKITVTISGKYSHQVSKFISVEKYTLPRFSVHIDSPDNVVVDDPNIRVAIYGKYTFDKYVEGTVTADLQNPYTDELIERKTLDTEGLIVVEFHMENVRNLTGIRYVSLRVTFEEKYTGVQQSSTVTITLREQRYQIIIPADEIEFRNRKPFRLKAHIKEWNSDPVFDPLTSVFMEHGTKTYRSFLNDDGVAVFEFDHQPNADHKVIFKNSKETFPNIYVPNDNNDRVESEFHCKLNLKERPRLGKPLQIEVSSSINIPYLVYTVVGHASIIQMEFVKVPLYKKRHTITVTPSIEMVPESFFYVHYIHNGDLKYEELTLVFPRELENQVAITAPKRVKPGQEVTLNIKAQPKSYVSILAVDLGVYLLDNSYDLYKTTILNDLLYDRSYSAMKNVLGPGTIAGLVTLTNAHYPVFYYDTHDAKRVDSSSSIFRTKFPETWIFENYEINSTDTQIVLRVPDTITTWRVTAFSNNAITGFGIVDGPTDITTILPFFITFHLPYSVKRGEIIMLPVQIFNYHNSSLDTQITLFNNDSEFEFIEPATSVSSINSSEKQIIVPAGTSKNVDFLIKAMKAGDTEIRITANNSLFNDGVVQNLKVLLEGITKYKNHAIYVSGDPDEPLITSFTADISRDVVPGSVFVTLMAGSDFMIPYLENLSELVKMSTGFGEQNMISLAPSVLVLEYLKATGKYFTKRELVRQAKQFIDIGYQQQLVYRHVNGGYRIIDKSPEMTSTWLTAYVVRYLMKASMFTVIEGRIIDSGLEYLAREQNIDGSFPHTGYLLYTVPQNSYGFTAFVLLTFMENDKYATKYHNIISKGLEYINSNLDDIDDIYALSIIGVTLTKAKHSNAPLVLGKLRKYIKEDENKQKWWTNEEKVSGREVEITGYILMALLEEPDNHLPLVKWLIKQRNEHGGFISAQDTVVAMEALVRFSQRYKDHRDWYLNVTYSAENDEKRSLKIDHFFVKPDNAISFQKHKLPPSVRHITLIGQGNGYCLLQLSYQYNVKSDQDDFKDFDIQIKPSIYNAEEMNLEICFSYRTKHAYSNNTNMVIMEANLPSGFTSEAENSHDLLENDFVQRIETKNDGTVVIVYFDKLSKEQKHCVHIETLKTDEVKMRQPAAILMYDYYNASRLSSEYYTV